MDQIKKALDILGTRSTQSAWIMQDDQLGGTQIDLLIDRDDDVMNMCEAKYSSGEFVIDKAYDLLLANRLNILSKRVSRKTVIHRTLITTYGLSPNKYSGDFSKVIVLDELYT